MTYLEIIEWIENNVTNVRKMTKGSFTIICVEYYGNGGECTKSGKDLSRIVLEINGKELIK